MITLKKSFFIIGITIITLTIFLLTIFVKDKDLVNKITIILSALLSLLIAFMTGITKKKHGLIYGLVVGISIASISLLFHYIYAKEMFDTLYLRMLIVILSGASGGVIGVNKKHPN